MELQASESIIGQTRALTMSEVVFFHVASRPVPFADLDTVLDPLLDALYAAKAQANIAEAGPDIVRYYRAGPGEDDLFLMEAGIPVKPGTQPAGEAQVKTLAPFHCVGLLLWGGLAHTVQAYETLRKAIDEAGLEPSGEGREWNYFFEAVDSPHNVMGLYLGVRSGGAPETA